MGPAPTFVFPVVLSLALLCTLDNLATAIVKRRVSRPSTLLAIPPARQVQ
jgi:hypothetical protein